MKTLLSLSGTTSTAPITAQEFRSEFTVFSSKADILCRTGINSICQNS
jgi:hypothetical protein